LIHLLTYDSDGFNRWDACQSYCLSLLNKLIVDHQAGRSLSLDPLAITAFGSLLRNQDLDPAMVALMLHLPSESLLHELADVIQPEAIHLAREFMRKALAVALVKELNEVYERYSVAVDYEPKAEQIGARSLKNAALSYLMYTGAAGIELAWKQFSQADNMTDKAAALTALVNCSEAQNYAEKALHILEEQYVDEALVMNLWLQIQATNSQSEGLARVKALLEHSAFTMTNPNKVRSLIGAFCSANLINFHTADGSGYQFLADQIIALNQANPQVAARLVTPLTRWKGFTKPYGALMRKQLQRIADHPNLVKDVLEVASKSL
jgi:aminopeptidase N